MSEAKTYPDPPVDYPAGNASPQEAIFAGGCFWCVEAVYRALNGVLDVTSGYSGGSKETANYRAVCREDTGHAEAVRIRFDPTQITYGQLLKVFFTVAHDPTQLNRQGPDVGRSYRSAIFYTDDQQKAVAEAYIEALNAARVFDGPIVTELNTLDEFYDGEEYHQNYAMRNPAQPYILQNVPQKISKLKRYFGGSIREGEL